MIESSAQAPFRFGFTPSPSTVRAKPGVQCSIFVWVLLLLTWMQPTAPGAHSSVVWSPFALYTFLFLSLHVLLLASAFIFCFPFAFMPPHSHTPPPPPPLFLHFKLHSLLLLSCLCLCRLISLLFSYFGRVFHNTCPLHYFALCIFIWFCSPSSICICPVKRPFT